MPTPSRGEAKRRLAKYCKLLPTCYLEGRGIRSGVSDLLGIQDYVQSLLLSSGLRAFQSCGKSLQLELLSLAYTLANRLPQGPQNLTLARVEHLYRGVGLPILKEPHRLTRCCEQLASWSLAGLLSYTDCVHSLPPLAGCWLWARSRGEFTTRGAISAYTLILAGLLDLC